MVFEKHVRAVALLGARVALRALALLHMSSRFSCAHGQLSTSRADAGKQFHCSVMNDGPHAALMSKVALHFVAHLAEEQHERSEALV